MGEWSDQFPGRNRTVARQPLRAGIDTAPIVVTRRLQRSRRSGSYVLLCHRDQPWHHGPRWELPRGGRKADLEERMRAYIDGLAAYRVWIHMNLRRDPTFLEPLRGRRLACPCPLEVRCPTDILVEQLAATA